MAPLVAVLDYGIGNLHSAQKALVRVGADAHLTADHGLIREAAGVVLPGVGSFGRCIDALERTKLDGLAIECAASGRPFLGVCIGMQMLYESSEESPEVPGLGVLAGVVRRLPAGVKRPQMQWNVLVRTAPSGLLEGVPEPAWTYFVHSFAADNDEGAVAVCDYGGPLVAAVERDALWATQFHPEKSGRTGMAILTNFVTRAADCARAA
jgi:glutamine amidotransferase